MRLYRAITTTPRRLKWLALHFAFEVVYISAHPPARNKGGVERGARPPRGCCDGNPTPASVNSSQLQPQLAMSKPWRQPAGHTKKKTQTHAKATTQTLTYAQTRTTLIVQHAYTTPDVQANAIPRINLSPTISDCAHLRADDATYDIRPYDMTTNSA